MKLPLKEYASPCKAWREKSGADRFAAIPEGGEERQRQVSATSETVSSFSWKAAADCYLEL